MNRIQMWAVVVVGLMAVLAVLAGAGFGVSKPSYTSGITDSISGKSYVYRNSVGYSGTTQYAANTTRPATVVFPQSITMSTEFTYTPIGTDDDKCYCVRNVNGTPSTGNLTNGVRALFTTVNGTDFVTVYADIKDVEPFKTYYDSTETGAGITRFVKLDDGSELLSMGVYSAGAFQTGKSRGAIFRRPTSTGAWTRVLTMQKGHVPQWGFSQPSIQGRYVCVSEYGGGTATVANGSISNLPANIYYSSDYGATWSASIYNETSVYTPDNATNNFHSHQIAFKPSDPSVIYCVYGDGTTNSRIIEITNSGGTWTKTHTFGGKVTTDGWLDIQPTCVLSYGNYLLWGTDSEQGSTVLLHNTVDNTMEQGLQDHALSGNVIKPFAPNNTEFGYVFGMFSYNGVMYATSLTTTSVAAPESGIYCSVDGRNWSKLKNTPATEYGYHTIAGYANGKIWTVGYNAAATYYLKGCCFTPATATNKTAYYAEKGVTNKIALAANSSFSSGTLINGDVTKWNGGYEADNSEQLIDGGGRTGLTGDYCLRVTATRGGTYNGLSYLRSPQLTTLCNGSMPPDSTAQFVMCSFWARAVAGTKEGITISADINSSVIANTRFSASNETLVVGPSWQKYYCMVYLTSSWTSSNNFCFQAWIRDSGADSTTSVVDFDDFQVTYSTVVDFRDYDSNYQYVTAARANEQLSTPLVGSTGSFSTAFAWYPKTGWRNFTMSSSRWNTATTYMSGMSCIGSEEPVGHYYVCYATQSSAVEYDPPASGYEAYWYEPIQPSATLALPIATIRGIDGSYVYIYWLAADQKIYMTDGTDAVATTATYPFLHNDLLKFGITSDGTGTICYIESPAGQVTLTGAATALSAPSTNINQGVDNTNAVYGTGAFTLPSVWTTILDSTDIWIAMNINYAQSKITGGKSGAIYTGTPYGGN